MELIFARPPTANFGNRAPRNATTAQIVHTAYLREGVLRSLAVHQHLRSGNDLPEPDPKTAQT